MNLLRRWGRHLAIVAAVVTAVGLWRRRMIARNERAIRSGSRANRGRA